MMENPAKKIVATADREPVNKDRYIILVIVLSGVFMGVLDTSVVNIALPTITRTFNVDMSISQWVVTSYLLVNTALLLIFGRISEYTGKVKLFIAGISIFTISSLACGLSTGVYELIFFRILQGIGSSVVFSINMAMLVQAFPKSERGRALGFIGTTVAIGSIAGPILGGFITDAFGWQYIFFINVPIGIVLVAAALRYLKIREFKTKELNMDWVGAGTLILTISSLMMLLGSLADCKELTFQMYVNAGVVLVSLVWFIITESTHKNPIVDLSVFKVHKFKFANLSTLINFITYSMFIVCMPFFLEISMGYTPSQVGQALLIIPFITAFISPLSGWLYDKFQSTYHSSFGMLVMSAGLFSMSYATLKLNVPLLLAGFAILAFGIGLFASPNNTEVMSALPLKKSGIASSTLATVRNFGNAIGVSLVSILLYMQLRACGFGGEMIDANPAVLAQSISQVLVIAGFLCIVGMGTSLMLGWHNHKDKNQKRETE
jgi:EmrB/QacA subfamily drug resistance transporter